MIDWEEGKFPEVEKYQKVPSAPETEDLEKMKLL
jgi:hypothetical protein